ncbi:hypothetical protein B0A55_12260 [Friedmanniomyces simplex]|uniref:Uncharacterized protein n=1 Tax=Friedmanniomyces simplex TaxID=329884 RepID=A0A4U0WBY3_9PEZI|nr:hypothetical protein B0A55_12260 [Friedmanniomyces simplex]
MVRRREIAAEIQALVELAQVESDVRYPASTTAPVHGLPVYFDRLKCSLRRMQGHCTEKHGWKNVQKRGGDARLKQVQAPNSIWTCTHACQQFFRVGNWKRYLEVDCKDDLVKRERHATNKHAFFPYFDRVAAGHEYFFSAETEESIRPEDNVQPTEEQLDAWSEVHILARRATSDEDEAAEERVQSKLIDFWMLLVCHKTRARRYRPPLLSFCAMLSIKPSTQGWIERGNFNSNLSAMIWVVQLLFFFDSARKEKRGQAETLTRVKRFCERFLQQTVETPMGEILRWRLLLFRVSKDSVGDHEAFWDETEQVLTYEDVEALLMAIEHSDPISRLFVADTQQSSYGFAWRDSALAAYESTVQEFLRRLSVLIQISGGQPVRESEFFSITWRNTQRRRSITLCHGRVMIHVEYHKGQQQTGPHRENIRFLPHPVGELLLDYIVYVMPLRQLILHQRSPKALLSAFLCEKNGKVWTDGQLSQCLEDASTRAGTPRLHITNWRQTTVAIVKTKFASQIGLFEANDDDEDAEEMEDDVRVMTRQRIHKTQTVNRANANHTGEAFGNVWDGLIRMALRASTLWQDFWGVETILKTTKRVYRPRKPWSSEALLGGFKKLHGNAETTWKSDEQREALYFAILRQKMDYYSIQPQNCYNMDEKGFLIGHLQKALVRMGPESG